MDLDAAFPRLAGAGDLEAVSVEVGDRDFDRLSSRAADRDSGEDEQRRTAGDAEVAGLVRGGRCGADARVPGEGAVAEVVFKLVVDASGSGGGGFEDGAAGQSGGEVGIGTYGDAIADTYDDLYGTFLADPMQIKVLAELAGDGPVVEVGSGTGRVALPLARAGVRAVGIDASGDRDVQSRFLTQAAKALNDG